MLIGGTVQREPESYCFFRRFCGWQLPYVLWYQVLNLFNTWCSRHVGSISCFLKEMRTPHKNQLETLQVSQNNKLLFLTIIYIVGHRNKFQIFFGRRFIHWWGWLVKGLGQPGPNISLLLYSHTYLNLQRLLILFNPLYFFFFESKQKKNKKFQNSYLNLLISVYIDLQIQTFI